METRSTSGHNLLLKLLLLSLFFLFFFFFFFFINTSSSSYSSVIGKDKTHSRPSQVTPTLLPALPFPSQALPTKSGYLPITTTSKSSIFYAFYEAENPILPLPNTPILIWLQGGPGCSSLYGNFLELGPWRVKLGPDKSFQLESNPAAWNRIFGVLFLDNPIGSGFSIASGNDIPRDHISIAKHLYIAITRFIELDNNDHDRTTSFRSRPVFIAGESYAGKYVPAIGHYIVKTNERVSERRRIKLGGVAIGNGLTDPLTQVSTHASNAYFSGLINDRQRKELEKLQSEVEKLVKLGKWREATKARYNVIDSLYAMTGLATLYDFTKRATYQIAAVTEFLNDERVKKALRADERVSFRGCSGVVKEALEEETMKSVKYAVEYLLRKSDVKVLLYQGMFDLWDGVVSTEAWVRTMDWKGMGRFMAAERKVWRDEKGELAGYVQKWRNLSNAVVFGAGHLVPVDQPVNSQTMIQDWVLGRGLFEDVNEVDSESEDKNLSFFDL